jgi:SAM-dependent methyltransferase
MIPSDTSAKGREWAEIVRSAEEARKFPFSPVSRAQVERYLDPQPDTPWVLEYAFHLLGDIRGKTVVDLGCGKGENLIPLAERGAKVIGIDLSPDLIQLAKKRIEIAAAAATVRIGSAYETGFESESVDVIFCVALIHHLEVGRVHDEMWRILKKGGFVVLSEPIRFSRLYEGLRRLFPSARGVSEFEGPLTRAEFNSITERFTIEGERYFRLPFVPLVERFMVRSTSSFSHKVSARMLRLAPALEHFATKVVVKLRKHPSN